MTSNVGTPFRSPREISELASESAAVEGGLAEDLLEPWAEFESPYRDLFNSNALEDAALEGEGFDGQEAGETYVAGAHLMEETPARDHPLAAVFALPRLAFDAMARGGWATAIAVAPSLDSAREKNA